MKTAHPAQIAHHIGTPGPETRAEEIAHVDRAPCLPLAETLPTKVKESVTPFEVVGCTPR